MSPKRPKELQSQKNFTQQSTENESALLPTIRQPKTHIGHHLPRFKKTHEDNTPDEMQPVSKHKL